jgi:hypothetical protein
MRRDPRRRRRRRQDLKDGSQRLNLRRGPIERFRDEVEKCAGHLLEVTGALSARLGHRA